MKRYKTLDLWKMVNNKKSIGYIIRLDNGKYDYQNFNDLGFFIEDEYRFCQVVKKVYVGKGYYAYQLRGGCEDRGYGTSLKTALACLKDCWGLELTKNEQTLVNKYFA